MALPLAHQKVRSRAPLRLGLAGGSTDLPHYAEQFGGAVLNATINRYAHVSLSLIYGEDLVLHAGDLDELEQVPIQGMKIDEGLRLHRAVYSRISRQFLAGRTPAVKLETMIDAPAGSGLGSSSALVVAMVEAFRVAFDLPLGPYDIARLAFDIERKDLALAGGMQDQYAAAFGGVNFIEFLAGERVIVNPLRLRAGIANEMMSSIIVCSTGQSRASHQIITDQVANVTSGNSTALEAMHQLKQDAFEMKAALLTGDVGRMAAILNRSWTAKKATSQSVSNAEIDRIWTVAHENGAVGGKISGAGGGGFLMFLTQPNLRSRLLRALREAGGDPDTVHFTNEGVEGWVVDF